MEQNGVSGWVRVGDLQGWTRAGAFHEEMGVGNIGKGMSSLMVRNGSDFQRRRDRYFEWGMGERPLQGLNLRVGIRSFCGAIWSDTLYTPVWNNQSQKELICLWPTNSIISNTLNIVTFSYTSFIANTAYDSVWHLVNSFIVLGNILIESILWMTSHGTYGAVSIQLTHFFYDDCENTYTLSYYHYQIESMTHLQLFWVRSRSNGMRCMSFYILMIWSAVDPMPTQECPDCRKFDKNQWCNQNKTQQN